MVKLATSMMVASPFKLAHQIDTIDHETDLYHVDLMDGHYVPNIAQSIDFVNQLKPFATKNVEVHLMVAEAEKFIDRLPLESIETLIFHRDTIEQPISVLSTLLRQKNVKLGIALSPKDPVALVADDLEWIDQVTVMTVEPGFAGQQMIPEVLPKISELKALKEHSNHSFLIEVDGSNNFETFEAYIQRGADILILGSTLFSYDPISEGYHTIKQFIKRLKS